MVLRKILAATALGFVAVLCVPALLAAQNKVTVMQGQLLGVRKSGEYREIVIDRGRGALYTLENYAFNSHDDYDFVVQVNKSFFVGRIKVPVPPLGKPALSRLMRDWPDNTPVQVRLKKKGVFKKRMEMRLVEPNGKGIPLLLVSVKDPIGRELCRKTDDVPDCSEVNVNP